MLYGTDPRLAGDSLDHLTLEPEDYRNVREYLDRFNICMQGLITHAESIIEQLTKRDGMINANRFEYQFKKSDLVWLYVPFKMVHCQRSSFVNSKAPSVLLNT